ncbi:sugar transferase [Cetobacterium sp.]|uniref:sugar transferase n=1 Tax=Cetobacterium sp. TaxID=2071632 RepID=UPI003F67DF75
MRKLKRIMDIMGAICGLSIYILIHLKYKKKISSDGGDTIFFQERIGKDLKEFKIYKFRTMTIDGEEKLKEILKDEKRRKEFEEAFKLKEDPRVTEVGKFLRKTSLDELPQFINILRGEMSLVGPRPVTKSEIENYYGDSRGREVFSVKPGLTGLWQVSGRSDVTYEERINMDLEYVRNWSIWLDIKIIFKTLKMVMEGRGAY